MIEDEVGEDVFSDGAGKLSLLQEWLYGEKTPFHPRIAPSIIARSEAELLGISTPRFGIRVYPNDNSFVNIRRRRITGRQIRQTYADAIADELLGRGEID